MSSNKKHSRKTKTNAEKKVAAKNYKNKKIKADKDQINALAKDRMEIQQSISEAITGVITLSKTLADPKVCELLPEATHNECMEHIKEFKDVVNKTSPSIKSNLKAMEELEKQMLNDTTKKDELWALYNMQGISMIDAVNELTLSSVTTTSTCSVKIDEALNNTNQGEKQ